MCINEVAFHGKRSKTEIFDWIIKTFSERTPKKPTTMVTYLGEGWNEAECPSRQPSFIFT